MKKTLYCILKNVPKENLISAATDIQTAMVSKNVEKINLLEKLEVVWILFQYIILYIGNMLWPNT